MTSALENSLAARQKSPPPLPEGLKFESLITYEIARDRLKSREPLECPSALIFFIDAAADELSLAQKKRLAVEVGEYLPSLTADTGILAIDRLKSRWKSFWEHYVNK